MNKPRRPPRRQVDGVLLLDKPSGISSNAALQKARWLFNAAKAGHTGTLDPMATGLLPLCFGEATKFAGELLDADKSYRATLKLGMTTDTADADGKVLETRPVSINETQWRAATADFCGEIEQIPPMHSALKRDGKPLYEYARAGIEVEREARKVTIHALKLLDFSGDRFTLRVSCSKGTYVRSLAMDIGAALGCGAHLCGLRRTRIGAFELDAAVTLAALEACEFEARAAMLAPVDALLAVHARIVLDAEQAQGLLQGRVLSLAGAGGEGLVRVYGPKGFLGLGQWQDGDKLAARRLIATDGGVLDASA